MYLRISTFLHLPLLTAEAIGNLCYLTAFPDQLNKVVPVRHAGCYKGKKCSETEVTEQSSGLEFPILIYWHLESSYLSSIQL